MILSKNQFSKPQIWRQSIPQVLILGPHTLKVSTVLTMLKSDSIKAKEFMTSLAYVDLMLLYKGRI